MERASIVLDIGNDLLTSLAASHDPMHDARSSWVFGDSTIEAAEPDGNLFDGRMTGSSTAQLGGLVALMEQCLNKEPRSRPRLVDVQTQLQRVLCGGDAMGAVTSLSMGVSRPWY